MTVEKYVEVTVTEKRIVNRVEHVAQVKKLVPVSTLIEELGRELSTDEGVEKTDEFEDLTDDGVNN
jgi:hypothetical protein